MYDPTLHLFVDDYNIWSSFAMKRIFPELQKHSEPLLTDHEQRSLCWGCVLHDNGKFRLWYQSVFSVCAHDLAKAGVYGRGDDFGYYPEKHPDAIPAGQHSIIGYAESHDGIHWEKPNLGIVEWNGNKDNNYVYCGSFNREQFGTPLTPDSVSIIRDDQEPDPQKRYKMINHWESFQFWDNTVHNGNLDRPEEFMNKIRSLRAKYLTTSPDGIHWDHHLTKIKECSGDYCGVTRDERNQDYWFNDRTGCPSGGIGGRTAGLCKSKDLYTWQRHTERILPYTDYEDYGNRFEHHGFTPFNYGDQDLGMLELSIKGFPIAGILCSHRDHERWRLVNGNQQFLPQGSTGSFDDSMLAVTRNTPICVGDKLYIYYNGRRFTPEEGAHLGIRQEGFLCLGTIRLDGFAGMTVERSTVMRSHKPAHLITQPVEVGEDHFQVNIEDHNGTAKVALFDETYQTVPGYELENCMPVDTNHARATVTWTDHPNISSLKGRKIGAMIQLESGTIYSVRY